MNRGCIGDCPTSIRGVAKLARLCIFSHLHASVAVGNESVVTTPDLPRWPKACSCGETWSREHWGELTPIGRYRADEWIELRSCVCGKTLAVLASELEPAT